jgi:hypothetical protein
VRLAVGDIVELIGPDRAARFAASELRRETSRQLHVVVRVLVGHGRNFDELGAAQSERQFLLLGLRVGDDDDAAVAERLRHQGKADAGIAGGAFDDRAAGLKLPLPLGGTDDPQRRAVLHGLARIQELRLAENLAAGRIRCALQPDQRRLSDEVDDGACNRHGIPCAGFWRGKLCRRSGAGKAGHAAEPRRRETYRMPTVFVSQSETRW